MVGLIHIDQLGNVMCRDLLNQLLDKIDNHIKGIKYFRKKLIWLLE
jgi:hypothetical protein